MALTDKQKRFVEEYLVDLNATQAAIRAGYSEQTAHVQGPRLLENVRVQEAIAAAQEARSARVEITQDMVLQRWWEIATADPNELIQLRRTCCRYCHGIDHQYQWTEREYFEAVGASSKAEQPLPSDAGGFGYDRTRDPHPNCPECHGEGREDVFANDTRKVKGGARFLYSGVKVTKDGIEIKMQDQGKALENVARHLGMFKEKVEHEHTGKDGGPIEMDATDRERAKALAALIAKAKSSK
jgi:phage terminase small subunit